MRKLLLALSLILCGLSLVAGEADAKRLGGGRSVGAQRNVTAPPASTPAKPAQQAAPQQGNAAGTTPATAQAQPSRWGMLGGILGGLALGGLLGHFFGGDGLMGFLVFGALAILAVMAIRAFMARRGEQQRPMQLAGMNETLSAPPPQPVTGGALTRAAAIPAGFDTAGFLKAAKTNFLRLQMAHDTGRVDEIREFTTGEMFDALREHFEAGQETDVVSLDADLLEVASENERHWASVRFSGTVRETRGGEPVGFTEVWNLVKPADGSSGWLLAGIQQMH
jgi:predicted lipid-binding transport protein (Tim44 family)